VAAPGGRPRAAGAGGATAVRVPPLAGPWVPQGQVTGTGAAAAAAIRAPPASVATDPMARGPSLFNALLTVSTFFPACFDPVGSGFGQPPTEVSRRRFADAMVHGMSGAGVVTGPRAGRAPARPQVLASACSLG